MNYFPSDPAICRAFIEHGASSTDQGLLAKVDSDPNFPMMNTHRFNVFGTLVAISGKPGAWLAFYPGNDGTRRPADFIIPADITEDGLAEYLADLFHEDATPRRSTVERLASDQA